MRLVRTPEDMRDLQAVLEAPQFLDGRYFTVWFETDPEALRALLPPPLEPTDRAVGNAWVGEVRASNCVGGFLGAALYLRARYKDIVGSYCLHMPMSTAEAITFGRELYGEPKKLAGISFERRGEQVQGSVERHGIRYMRFQGRLTGEGPAGRRETSIFHFKYQPRPDGRGFDHPPVLVHVKAEFDIKRAEEGSGELVLADSPHDPVADLPVLRVTGAMYTEGDIYTRGEILCEADPQAFLPYAFAKMDDFRLIARDAETAVRGASG